MKHVLYYLNGSYITGYSSKDKKPFEELDIIIDFETDIVNYLNRFENLKYKKIADKTKKFLSGFYSNFGLEMLSTVDYIKENDNANSVEKIIEKMQNWNERKRTLFATNPNFVKIALSNIEKSVS